jgi:hypothetical protein
MWLKVLLHPARRPGVFTGLLAQAVGDSDLAETITSLLDQADGVSDAGTA